MHKKMGLVAIVVVFLAASAFVFIKTNNDHCQCSTIKETTFDKNGNKVFSEKHHCKEDYSF